MLHTVNKNFIDEEFRVEQYLSNSTKKPILRLL